SVYRPRPRSGFDAVAARLGVARDRPYVLFVGTLEPRKNVTLLLEAMAKLRGSVEVQLVVVGGPGFRADEVYRARERLGLGEAVRHAVDGWAEADGRLVRDDLLAERQRTAGFARAAEFSWDRAAVETMAVYREALETADN